MKIFFYFFIPAIIIFYGRFSKIVKATETEKSDSVQIQIDNLQTNINAEEKLLTLQNTIEKNQNILEETENQELLLPSQSVVSDSSLLRNIEVTSELSSTPGAVVFPSTDTTVELQNKAKAQFENDKLNSSNQLFNSFESKGEEYVVHAEPKVQVQPIKEETLKHEMNESELVPKSSQEELKKTAPQHEDIPSFSEWTQKQLAEAEKKKTDQNETTERFAKTRGKFRNKNYASPDCGAKIVAANPESLSSSAVLSPLKDEYMLNYCTNRIWFVVELCEAIQAKQLDLANFELFSSSPKVFSVYVSHRFPTRDWSNVGKFTAQDSRDVQTFNLHPHLFGKYVKVELHSHYGREQFCPISWVGVYGTSEYEVLAKEDDRHTIPEEDDQYDEELLTAHKRDAPKNLFSSATDAVLSIVKKATAPFMKSDSNETKSEALEDFSASKSFSCISPRYITVCNNCSQNFYDEVFHALSCFHFNLDKLVTSSFIKRTLINSETCTKFGLDFNSLRKGAPFPSNYLENPRRENYLTVMLKNSIVAAMCNVLAVSENKVVVNATVEPDETLKNLTKKTDACEVNPSKSEVSLVTKDCVTCRESAVSQTKTSLFADFLKSSQRFSKKIEPTKTLTEDEAKKLLPSEVQPETSAKSEKSTDLTRPTSTATPTSKAKEQIEDTSVLKEQKVSFIEVEKEPEAENKSTNASNDSTLESIISDINAIESRSAPTVSNLPTESIFLRLANRIKNLEINMSLSSTYLEELSKRYRVQLELLSKTLNLTIQKMEEQTKAEEEKGRKREKEMLILRLQLANLTRDVSALLREKNSWRPRASSISQHAFFVSIEILLVWFVFNYRKRFDESKIPNEKLEAPKKFPKKYKRRNSLEGVKGHETPKRKTRRPSDEALEALALARDHVDFLKKKKRRKKESNAVQIKRKRSEGTLPEATEEPKAWVASEETPEKVPEFIPNNVVEIETTNRFEAIASPKSREENNTVARALYGISASPIFIKTALAARNSRLKFGSDKESSQVGSKMEQETKKDRKGPNGLKKYMKKFF